MSNNSLWARSFTRRIRPLLGDDWGSRVGVKLTSLGRFVRMGLLPIVRHGRQGRNFRFCRSHVEQLARQRAEQDASTAFVPCRHCHTAPIARPRGLCWACYYRPGVRDLYPSTSKFGCRGIGNGHKNTLLPDRPTCALPGTEAKIRVLGERARLGQSLWHPDDVIFAGQSALAG